MAADVPPGFELDTDAGMTPAPVRARVEPEVNTVSGEPWYHTYVGSQLPAQRALPVQMAGGGVPAGFTLDEAGAHDRVGTVTGLVRSAAESLTGNIPNYLNALTEHVIYGTPTAEAYARQKRMSKGFEEEHPIASTAAGLAGGVAGGGALLRQAPVMGARLLGMTGQTLPGQIARMGLSGAGIGAGEAVLHGEDPMRGAQIGGLLGAGGAVGSNVIGGVAGGLANRIANAVPLMGTAGIKAAASAGFKSIDDAGVILHPYSVREAVNGITKELEEAKFRPEYQPGVYRILNNLANPKGEPVDLGPGATFGDIMGGKAPGVSFSDLGRTRPANVKFGDLMAARQALNDVASGLPSPDRTAAGMAMHGLDDFMNNLKPPDVIGGNAQQVMQTLNTANQNWAAYKASDLIEKAMQKAENRAASTYKGTNIANAQRQEMNKLLTKIQDGRIRVSPEVRAAIERAVQGRTPIERLTRFGSSFAPTGIVSMATAPFVGHTLGGPPGALGALGTMAAGHVSKMLNDRIIRQRVLAALQAAQARAPAAQAARAAQPDPMTARVLQRVANYAPGSAAMRTPALISTLLNQPQQPP